MRAVVDRPWMRYIVVAALAAAAGAGVWLVVRHVDGRSQASSQAASSSTDVDARSLRALVAALRRPVYWAGPREGVSYEFTETADHRTYVRYLPEGVAAGSSDPYLTVASYPVANAFAVTGTAAAAEGTVKLVLPGGGVAFYSKARPTNVYVAFPHSKVQVEVYSPELRTLRNILTSGRIGQVADSSAAGSGATVETQARTTSKQALVRLAGTLAHPIYWLGAIRGRRLELSRTPDGRTYLRYLPAGVAAGSGAPYLTVATYPLPNGFAVANRAASKKDAVSIALPHGAVAFYSRARPTNVYVAFPGVDEQVEIYDPSARQARQLVAAHKLEAVS